MGMIPGFNPKTVKGLNADEKEFVRVEAIIRSMTKEERKKHHIINASRRRRIARGSGTEVKDVNQLLKRYTMASKMMKKLQRTGLRGFGKGMFPGL